ncbi:MAG: hypothetical protein ABSF67_20335 [Roseiarcus sp.]|jgi:hypothetical protein
MKRTIGILFLTLLGCTHAVARDGFENVRCDGDIVKALVGQRGVDEPVVATEARHKDLNLKDLGASDDDGFSSITWLICGKEFMVLENDRTNLFHDALQIPPHSSSNPEFQGFCKVKGKAMRQVVVAILRDQNGQDELPADAAWKIDEKAIKFVKMATDDLLCPRSGIWDPLSGSRP